jgi:hypothetical protein
MNRSRKKIMIGFAALTLAARTAFAGVSHQPIFVLYPVDSKIDAWSVFVDVDQNESSKILQIGVERLVDLNSKTLGPESYEKVLAAQNDAKTPREQIAVLAIDALEIGELNANKQYNLSLSCVRIRDDTYRLLMRFGWGIRKPYVIGGKNQDRDDIQIKYNQETKTWTAYAVKLRNSEGNQIAEKGTKVISGFLFPTKSIPGLVRLIGVVDGEPFLLVDKSWDW